MKEEAVMQIYTSDVDKERKMSMDANADDDLYIVEHRKHSQKEKTDKPTHGCPQIPGDSPDHAYLHKSSVENMNNLQ